MATKKKTKAGEKKAKPKKTSAKKTVKKIIKKKAPAKKTAPKEASKVVEKEVRKPPIAVDAAPPSPPAVERKKIVLDSPHIIVKDLAEKMKLKVGDVIKALMTDGVMATINQRIDISFVKAVAAKFETDVEYTPKKEAEKEARQAKVLEHANLVLRDPVVTIMGHVDHGKTKLLDTIRQTNVIAKEAGGITQHIGAYQATVKGKKITFLDTPGHEAFTALRARGAKVTDIAVLVVAADDGVMPQTVEAIDHAKAAQVPIIVAINKIDKPEANLDRVKKQLSELGLSPEDWGGKTVTVPISAKQAQGIDDLLEMIILVADMLELKADPTAPAIGVVVESKLEKGRGPVASVLIQSGTLRVQDSISIGGTSGRVRAIFNDKGVSLRDAGPSMPVEILGCSEVPHAGDTLLVAKNDKEARAAAQDKRDSQTRAFGTRKLSLEAFSKHVKEGERKDLKLILKTDVHGSLEALEKSLADLSVGAIQVKIIHAGTGNINESDVMLAEASQAVIIGFHVSFDGEAKEVAEREGVDVKNYDIIYNLIDDVRLAMEGLLEPEYEEVSLGQAEVRALFKYSKVGTIAGCFINTGKFVRGSQMRILRDGEKIYEGRLESLKRFKEDVKSVEKGYECGIAVMGFNNFKVGDIIEVFEMRVKPRKRPKA
jgi:translation initiation factor IF-2